MNNERVFIYSREILSKLIGSETSNEEIFKILSSCLVSFICSSAHEMGMDPLKMHSMHTNMLADCLDCTATINESKCSHVEEIRKDRTEN